MKSTETPVTKMTIQEIFRDKELQCHYYETIVNSTKDMIFLTDGRTVLDANKAMIEFCQRSYRDVYSDSFLVETLFEPIEKFGYIFEGYKDQSWLKNALNNPDNGRVGVVQKGKLYTFNISLCPLFML